MHIAIHDYTLLKEIKTAFSDFYPYLKIEFFSLSHSKYGRSSELKQISPEMTISSLNLLHRDGIIEIKPENKIADIEQEFKVRFGLHAQVFRKEKDTWVQTTGEDDFTIYDLNIIGRNASDEYILEEEDIDPGEEKPEKLL
jgi:hypothetical protein